MCLVLLLAIAGTIGVVVFMLQEEEPVPENAFI
jgi:hypothetical protein